ncbi:MAG: histidine phosphatase family protein [Eubacteriales bacterium]|nr:histidine phosphatase family protein [Eubacteriales bacterium]
MLTLYFARHGETIWNTQSRMQGRLDTDLTEKGLEQALALGALLRGIPFDQVYVSPTPRAQRTTQLALEAGQFAGLLQAQTDERVHEMDLGDWEGLSVDEVKAIAGENLQKFFFSPSEYVPTGSGETYAQVSARMADFLHDIEEQARVALTLGQPRHVLLISHNITLKALLALLKRRPLEMLRDGPPLLQASLYRATYQANGTWEIVEPEQKGAHP